MSRPSDGQAPLRSVGGLVLELRAGWLLLKEPKFCPREVVMVAVLGFLNTCHRATLRTSKTATNVSSEG
jgi:hypothetical protein